MNHQSGVITFIVSLFLALGFSTGSMAQWSPDPSVNTRVAQALNDQQDQRMVADGKGGVIITWADFRNSTQYPGVYVQRLDKNGNAKWASDGIPVCTTASVTHSIPVIAEDGSGGAIIVWQDWRSGNKDIYAQRVDSNGIMLWASCGVAVVAKAFDQQNPHVISDGTHGAVIVWEDSINGNWDIFTQKISSGGGQAWTSGGVALCTSIDEQINPRIETDGAGGGIVTWQDKRSGSDYDIYAQKITTSGTLSWAVNGVGICTLAQTQNNPKLKSDGASGAYISWTDKRTGTDYDIYCQRINSAGVVQWTTNGTAVCSSTGNQSALDITTDFITGVVIAWKDFRNTSHYDIYAQRLDGSGSPQWTANGVPVCTSVRDQINPDLTGDGTGGVILVWQDSSAGNWDVYSQKLNSGGLLQWAAGGVAVGTATGNQTSPKSTADGAGGVIFTFQDKRSGTFDLYAHHLNASGVPDFIDEFNEATPKIIISPQPAKDHVLICYEGFSSQSTLNIYDILGNNVTQNFTVLKSDNGKFELIRSQAGVGFYLILFVGSEGKVIVKKLLFEN